MLPINTLQTLTGAITREFVRLICVGFVTHVGCLNTRVSERFFSDKAMLEKVKPR